MKQSRTLTHVALIIVFSFALGFFNLPGTTQENILSATPDSISSQQVNLGLDLQGGTQLDYKIDLRKVAEEDHKSIIDGVLEVINRRVNALGVSEPNIYEAKVADESHIIVELAGIEDIDEAKSAVGKTIQLEFKEQNPNTVDDEARDNAFIAAESALERINTGESFDLVAQEEELSNPGQISYYGADSKYVLESEVNPEFIDFLQNAETGDVSTAFEGNDGYSVDQQGNLSPIQGVFILKLIDKREGVKEINELPSVEARHVLIAYEGSERADASVTRTKEEALTFATELSERAKNGESINDLALEYSDESAAASTKGELGRVDSETAFVKPFKDAALALGEDEISDPVETTFGFHIIQAYNVEGGFQGEETEMEYSFERLVYSTIADPWIETELTGEHFVRADVAFNHTYQPLVNIEFNSEGGKLFEELTERNINKPIAIFVGGDLISAPNVNQKITGGSAQITGQFTIEEASNLARDLNTGAIPAPILLVGQYTIGASLGQDALDSSIQAGLLGLLLLGLYMLFFYRLPGLMANIALVIYASILLFFIKVSMPIGAAISIGLAVFLFLINAILKSNDSGAEKMLSFFIASFVLFFITFLLTSPVTLTLAGVAGVILSIGMAVDANILIFERMREELHNKRPLASAIDVGFDRAWSSIRDSNFSSLITCAILMYFGSSIIKGFAVNLALGILISMFTAITITRSFLKVLVGTKGGENAFLMGVPKKGHTKFKIVQNRKIWFSISSILLVASLILIPTYGLKLGLDFTGGTLMETQFETTIETEQIKETIKRVDTEEAFGEPIVVSSGENSYILRMKHISNEAHDALLLALEQDFGTFEETRFTTIGPTIGDQMKQKAIIALAVALLMIILYIAFAFRHVPKAVSAWRFGACAIGALVHDVLITVGVFVFLGHTLGVEIDALFITALLTIMGFSVHDTIVTFDRIRENLAKQKAGEKFEDVANRAVNETLVRSINTSISTLFTVAMLFALGAGSIKWFLFALIIGLIAGTYSSVFTATPLLVAWHQKVNKD